MRKGRIILYVNQNSSNKILEITVLKAVLSILILVGVPRLIFADQQPKFNLFSSEELALVRSYVNQGPSDWQKSVKRLRRAADAAMTHRTFSITYYPAQLQEASPNDYYSESIYWWPDPTDPQAPYIRKDGQRNPNCFTAHKEELVRFCNTTLLLAAAAYLFNTEKYAVKARSLIQTWFIDPATRMNPHARFAQVIPHTQTIRGVGILDTRHLILVIESVAFLQSAGYWDTKLNAGLQEWFRDYLTWLLSSEYGQDESSRGNNHSSWYAVQVATYTRFVDQGSVRQNIWRYVIEFLLENQIAADGSQPLELKRTRSLDYSLFNLEALGILAREAEQDGLDLWQYRNRKGASLITALEYVRPYFIQPKRWSGQQITPTRQRPVLCLYYAARKLERSDYEQLFLSLKPLEDVSETLVFLMGLCAQVRQLTP